MAVPVVLFAFNRPNALRASLEALAANDMASDTPLYIRLDGPRNESDAEKVAAVYEVALGARGFRSVEVVKSDRNRGLASSIILGVSQLLDSFESVIVLEDDLVTHPGFLEYMNVALEKYQNNPDVFSICGYSSAVQIPSGYEFDAYFCPRSSSWGWATWRDRWNTVDWNPSMESVRKHSRSFNRWGGSDCASMLRSWVERRNSSWAIRFCYSEFLQGKLSLFPVDSLVNPTAGFAGDGTHCRSYNRFRFRMAPERVRSFLLPGKVEMIPSIHRSALRYHSLWLRAWTYLMNLLHAS